jgi:hypothetical protein
VVAMTGPLVIIKDIRSVGMTQEEYLEALRSGAKMNFNDLIKLINENYNYTPASFINGDLQNTARVVKNALVVFTKTM